MSFLSLTAFLNSIAARGIVVGGEKLLAFLVIVLRALFRGTAGGEAEPSQDEKREASHMTMS